jgi:hypothetical protein
VVAVTQTFCRHNRFVQRCPICRETVPGYTPPQAPAKPKQPGARPRQASAAGAGNGSAPAGTVVRAGAGRAHSRAAELHVRRERRFVDDGYRSDLLPGLRSSHDAQRLVEEIGFASGRLLALTAAPPGLYAEARDCEDIEQATWMCFLAVYLSPQQGEQPFSGVRQALLCKWSSGGVPDLEDVPLGPRTSHDPGRGSQTLLAYRRFAEHAGSQERAFAGEPEWTPQRRFERVFERLSLPGFGRMGRYDLLLTLGRLGMYELRADSLHLAVRPGSRPTAGPGIPAAGEDPTLAAAKRVFGIGDPVHIERRASQFAEAIATPIEALDLALYNWGGPPSYPPASPAHARGSPAVSPPEQERVTLGFPLKTSDAHAIERARCALDL